MTPLAARVLAAHLSQPDQRTCGPACLVTAHMLNDPSYAERVLAARDFAEEVRRLHHRATSPVDHGVHLPWPRALGTPPWAAARLMSDGCGRPGRRYRSRLATKRPETLYVALCLAIRAGHVLPVYLGSRRLPRHVVLAVAHTADGLQVYDPATGHVVPLPRDAFATGTLSISGWSRPWFAVLPRNAR